MAAPSGTTWGSIAGGYGRIGIYTSVSSTATTTTVALETWFWSKYSVSDTNNSYYYSTASSATSLVGSRSIQTTVDSGGGWSTSNQVKLGSSTYNYPRTTSAQTKYYAAKLTGVEVVGATMTVSKSITVPALASYKVSYNANGGSGAPGSQTKWYGTTLKLSSTKPNRSGYSFQGWATSSSGSVAYAAGANYTANAAVTLYAKWKANTYTVSYNANGGSGAPSSQTKTYGVNLTLSSTKPTRTNYTFKGWGTSASSTSVAYASGATYTSNASITLYAIWSLSYKAPRIASFSAQRCNSSGTASETGTYLKVTFSWSTDRTVSAIRTQHKLSTSGTWTNTSVTASGTSGNVSVIIGSGGISTESSYQVRAYVSDSGGTTYSGVVNIGTVKYPIDVKSGGTGVAFGKVAEIASSVDCGWAVEFRENAYLGNNKTLCGRSADGQNLSLIYVNSNNNTVVGYGGYINEVGQTNIYGQTVNIYSLTGVISTGATLYLSKGTDASATADNGPPLIIGSRTGGHLELDSNEIMAKSSSTTASTLYLNNEGGAVNINGRQYGLNIVLWSGAWYMNETQTANLSGSISNQPHGAIFAWSYYNGTAQNYNWEYFFVPKYHVKAHAGTGITFSSPYRAMFKYVYVSDTSVKGHANNNLSAASNGINWDNTNYVLRYIIGV